MKYNCIIKEYNSFIDEEVTVLIGNITLTGFCNSGIDAPIDSNTMINIELFDCAIWPTEITKSQIKRIDKGFEYNIYGILDIANAKVKSLLDFEIAPEILYDYSYLDGKPVCVNALRLDISL